MLRKLLICPYFGDLPPWMDAWERNVATLEPMGYDVLRVHDLDWFKQRVRDVLDIDCPIVEGEGKIHDYRCAFGLIFAEEIEDYDFWGHTDFDVVYGRVARWVTDALLDDTDLFSNHHDYVSGPFSLYRNYALLNRLFKDHPDWRLILENPTSTGWVEKDYTALVDDAHDRLLLNRQYASWQAQNLDDFSRCRWDGDRLMEGDTEILMAHFRRVKIYPPQLIR